MPTIRSLSLRLFPGRTRITYAVTWRTQRGADTTDRRLYWGDVPIAYDDLESYTNVQLLLAVVNDLARKHGTPDPGEAAGAPLGGLQGGSTAEPGLPGIDEDD